MDTEEIKNLLGDVAEENEIEQIIDEMESGFDFEVFYKFFKDKMTEEEFVEKLESLGGYEQDCDAHYELDGKKLSEEEIEKMGIEFWDDRVKVVEDNPDNHSVKFYDYDGYSLKRFFKENGVDHASHFNSQKEISRLYSNSFYL